MGYEPAMKVFCAANLGPAAVLALAVWAPGSQAQPADLPRDCRFVTECFDGEGCGETDFTLTLEGSAPNAFKLVTDAETVAMSGATADGVLTLHGRTASSRQMITASPEGARYTVHFLAPPMVVSYLGACD